MGIHEIKLRIEFCDAVLSGEKPFEVRRNDRGYQRGDTVRFIPMTLDEYGDPVRAEHPVENREYRITYVINGWGLRDGYVVFGIRDVTYFGYDLSEHKDLKAEIVPCGSKEIGEEEAEKA